MNTPPLYAFLQLSKMYAESEFIFDLNEIGSDKK